jgi:branched-chain amino acid transport system substrate-binding protein
MTQKLTRRSVAQGLGLAAAGAAAGPAFRINLARAQAKTAKIAMIAMIAPMSGPWARQGQLLRMGADLLAEDVNSAGGIKALGGAKLEVVYADAGDNTEKAKNAAQRLVADQPDLAGGTGSWLSSFTLAVTEVTERASLPWLTLSYSDAITNRGFKFVFQTSPTADWQAAETLPTALKLAEAATGKRPKTIGIIQDNTASPVSFGKQLREGGGLDKVGLKAVVDEIFTPPLSDATPIVGKVRSAKPEFLMLLTSAMPDCKLVLEKLDEFKLARGKMPLVGNGAPFGSPELLTTIGPELLEGLLFSVANWPLKGQEEFIERFKKRTGEPFLTQDGLCGYGHTWILKEALERAGAADKLKVAEAIRGMNLTEGPAALSFPGPIKFDDKGRRQEVPMIFAQWQKGVPVTVYPEDRALGKPYWPSV